jgi:hypothetical protein
MPGTSLPSTLALRRTFRQAMDFVGRALGDRSLTSVELAACGADEVRRMAHDLAIGPGDLRVMAYGQSDAAVLLRKRMRALGLDAEAAGALDPRDLRDLQRCCSLCDHREVCAFDLACDPKSPEWQAYCPNVATLRDLLAEKASSAEAA